MSLPFTLSVPLDARYRVLAPAVAGKYAELLGAGPGDAQGLATKLAAALDGLAAANGSDGHADLSFRREADGVRIEVHCAGRASVLTHRIPAAKR